jgi:hypothetical protein
VIVINWQPGQLGNCLMLWSHFISYGIENEKAIMNPRFLQYAEYFENIDKNFLFLYPSKKYFKFLRPLNDHFFKLIPPFIKIAKLLKLKNVEIISLEDIYYTKFDLEDILNEKLLNKKVVLCNGWQFRGTNLVRKHRNEIIKFFIPKKCYATAVENKMNTLKQIYDVVVGIHIRRGDFKNFYNGRFCFDDDIYKEMIARFVELENNKTILFLICTNDEIDQKKFSGYNLLLNNGNTIEDLLSLSKCDYIIGPPSSYNIWASYYGEVPTYHIEDCDYQYSLSDFRIMYDLNVNY